MNKTDIAYLKSAIANVSTVDDLAFARAAWGSASTHRGSDKRGGANGARIRLAPQNKWEVNRPDELAKVLSALEDIQKKFNKAQKDAFAKNHTGATNGTNPKAVSLADLIVLAGGVDIEKAAKKANYTNVTVPFTPGRMDASLNQTDVESFEWLHPVMDGFRNFETGNFTLTPEKFLLDRSQLLSLSAPEMTALVGGFRAMNLNWDDSDLGVFTKTPGALTNDYFVNLLNMDTKWIPLDDTKHRFEGINRDTGEHEWYRL